MEKAESKSKSWKEKTNANTISCVGKADGLPASNIASCTEVEPSASQSCPATSIGDSCNDGDDSTMDDVCVTNATSGTLFCQGSSQVTSEAKFNRDFADYQALSLSEKQSFRVDVCTRTVSTANSAGMSSVSADECEINSVLLDKGNLI